MGDEATPPMTLEDEYRARVESMTAQERIGRAESLFAWSRGVLTRSVVATQGPLADERLKWEVAIRQYGTDPRARRLIDELRTRATR